jgi:uncharacterized membrane-anchored protein
LVALADWFSVTAVTDCDAAEEEVVGDDVALLLADVDGATAVALAGEMVNMVAAMSCE